ncbi:MAG: glycosyltransferase family 39 protein [Acetobacteraceae bacterium]|nr:glycosyltransferase family 39 protein [Acetobacteraceae bacterium]
MDAAPRRDGTPGFLSLETARPRLLLALFCLVLWLPGLFTLPPGDRDESRFAQATKQMLETGDFVRIQNGTEARNRKPIGIYWLQAPFAAAAGALGIARANPIWPYRMPSVLGALLAVLATFELAAPLLGRQAALLGAGFLAASVVLSVETHIAKTDAALLGSIVVAMAVLARAYLRPATLRTPHAVLFWLALAASILLKGPIGPMVAGLTALTLSVADRRAAWLRPLRPAWGIPLMIAAVLPWFVAIGLATHGRFFADAIGGDLGRKLSSGDDAHWGPPGLHLLLLPVLALPATAAIPAALLAACRDRTDPVTRFLLAWLIPSWLVFEAVPTKLPHYTLPLYPALCLLAAAWLLRRDRRPIGAVGPILAVAVSLALAAALGALPVILHQPLSAGLPASVAACLIAALFVPLFRRRGSARWQIERRALFSALVCMPLLYWTALGWELPRLTPLWLAPRVVAELPPGRLGAVGFAEPSLMFLTGTDTEFLTPAEGAAALASGAVTTLLVGDRDLPAVLADARRDGPAPERIGIVRGFNYSRGRFVTLTLLAADQTHRPR